MQLHQSAAFLQRAVHFFGQSGHILFAAAVNDLGFARAQSERRTHAVHRHVAAADDNHAFAREIRRIVAADGAEQIDRRIDVLALFALDADLLVALRTDGDINRVVLLAQIVNRDIFSNFCVVFDFNARGKDAVDILLQAFTRETIVWYAVAQHAAQLGPQFKNGAAMSHQLKIIGRAQAARPPPTIATRLPVLGPQTGAGTTPALSTA